MTRKPTFHRGPVRLTGNQIAFLNGLLYGYDDLPDGAWQAACESAIETSGRFKFAEPYDIWLAWCEGRVDDNTHRGD